MNKKTIHIEVPSEKTLAIAKKMKDNKTKVKAELEKKYFRNKEV